MRCSRSSLLSHIRTRTSQESRSRATVTLETDHIGMRESQLSMISRVLHLLMIDILAVGAAIRRASTNGELPEAVAQARAGKRRRDGRRARLAGPRRVAGGEGCRAGLTQR